MMGVTQQKTLVLEKNMSRTMKTADPLWVKACQITSPNSAVILHTEASPLHLPGHPPLQRIWCPSSVLETF